MPVPMTMPVPVPVPSPSITLNKDRPISGYVLSGDTDEVTLLSYPSYTIILTITLQMTPVKLHESISTSTSSPSHPENLGHGRSTSTSSIQIHKSHTNRRILLIRLRRKPQHPPTNLIKEREGTKFTGKHIHRSEETQ